MSRPIIFGFFLLLVVFALNIPAQPLAPNQVPAPLKPWIDWVLDNKKDRLCPFIFNNYQNKFCQWPGRLDLDLNEKGGKFTARWKVYAPNRVELPGNIDIWPKNIKLNNRPAVVHEYGGKPALWLEPGSYRISGDFAWPTAPKRLTIPGHTGMIRLTWNRSAVKFPELDNSGQLLLGQEAGSKSKLNGRHNTLVVKTYRHLTDEVPLLMKVRIDLDVAGQQRELVLDKSFTEDFIPLSLDSPIPARLEKDGKLRMQVRPGRWSIEMTLRSQSRVTELKLPKVADPWPKEEVWVFDARPYHRLVELEGAASIDPSQTSLPAEWRSLPAYRMGANQTLRLKVIRRGDPQPEPNRLSLNKTLWLDFNGNGYTVKDVIEGTMTRGWRLTTVPKMKLGQVVEDGVPRLITLAQDSGEAGVEVRRGRINLTADSRIEGRWANPDASGWQQDFKQARVTLNLPPGWKVFSISGVDNKPDTWLNRWTLLDLFLVLVIAISTAKLWNKRCALLALATLVLIWHEPKAPQYVWIGILASIALLKVVPTGRLSRSLRTYLYASLIFLVIIGIPFLIGQVRTALYPQLERPWQQPMPIATTEQAEEDAAAESMDELSRSAPVLSSRAKKVYEDIDSYRAQNKGDYLKQLEQIDPKAKIQTGPGLPQWRWNEVFFQWKGPVSAGQTYSLILLSPPVNKLLNMARVMLLLIFAAFIIRGASKSTLARHLSKSTPALLLLPLLLAGESNNAHADIPDPALLKELREKLLQPPVCLPDCAQIQYLKLRAKASSITLNAEIHAQQATAIPIPAPTGFWTPQRVSVNGTLGSLYRTKHQALWLLVDKGMTQVSYSGLLPPAKQIKIPLPLRPHRVVTEMQGWTINGIYANGRPDSQLQLVRTEIGEKSLDPSKIQSQPLSPFFRIERNLQLALEWTMTTRIVRLSDPSEAIIGRIPLLNGEAITSRGIRVDDGMISVNLPPGQKMVTWQSVLDRTPTIRLKTQNTDRWAERWRVTASPIWHLEYTGIPVIYNQNQGNLWSPEWHPWPREEVILTLTKPQPFEGNTLTIDNSQLTIKPGKRSTDTELLMTLRSYQGGQHTIRLPEKSQLLNVAVNGQNQPIRLSLRELTLPLKPGKQTYRINWRAPYSIESIFRSGQVQLNTKSVNHRIQLILAKDRWVLMTFGPQLGPAVLFWGVLAVILLAALALGRFAPTPLGFFQWFLLLVGLSQIPVETALIVPFWFIGLALRKKLLAESSKFKFNLVQVGLVLLTFAASTVLVYAVSKGLLGQPSMQIAGNGSSAYILNWYQDHADAMLPSVRVASIPLWIYHVLMLLWALWLALSLLRWLPWAWECFSHTGIWRSVEWRQLKKAEPSTSQAEST